MTDVITRQVKLRGAAREVMNLRAPEILLCGAAGTGKSFAALYKIHLMMLANPGARALVVRRTHVSLTQTGLVTFRDQVLPEALKTRLVHWYGGSAEKPAGYVYSNGSFVAVGGMDQAAKIMSSEYDVIFCQEATDLSKDDWEKLTTRLRNGVISFQQIIGDCNPQQPSHWLKKRCDEGQTKLLTSLHEDNPRIMDGNTFTRYGLEYLEKLDALSGVRYLRLRKGLWAAAEGIIYADWRPDIHLIDRKVLPFDWTRIWTVDFGFRHPFVWQMWAIDPDGALILEKEIHKTETLVEDHAVKILETVTINKDRVYRPDGRIDIVKSRWKYSRPQVILCDHDAEDRATLERHLGMGTVAAWKGVSDGIQAVQARLKVGRNGRAGMYVCRDSLVERDTVMAERGKPLSFAQEIEGYVWKEPPRSVGQEKPPPDEPSKIDDDSMDAGRYAVAYADLQPVPRVRWL